MSAELNDMQELFCQEYVIDLHTSRAAIRAGYAPKSAHVHGCKLLKIAKIKKRVAEVQAEIGERCHITQDRVLEEYSKIAFTNMEDVVDWIDGIPTLQSADDISPSAHAAISEISRTVSSRTGNVTTKIKLHDKKGALDSLAKYLGICSDTLQVTGEIVTHYAVEFTPNRVPESDGK